MYTAVLVDDERSLLESIEQLVDWEKHGFQILGTAQNGFDALELMSEDKIPDVVITDIKMPVMDGIELAKVLREEYPTIKIVFLSGYEEFQYAVEGIKLNVVSYLLKPISKNEIEECLDGLKKELDEEVKSVNDLSRVNDEYQKNIEMMRLSFLNSLLTEYSVEGKEAELSEFLETHNLNYLKDEKILVTIRFTNDYSSKFQSSKNKEFQRFSLFQIVQDVVKKYTKSEVFLFSSYVVCILTGTLDELENMIDIVTKDIIETTKKLLQVKVIIGVSENYKDLYHTRKAYRDTLTALDYALAEEEENIIFISDIEKTSARPQFLYEIDESSLLFALKTNDTEFMKTLFEKYFDEKYYNHPHRISLLRTVTSIIYVNSIRALRETIGKVDAEFNHWYQQIFETIQYEDLQVIQNELYHFCLHTMTEIAQNRAQLKSTLIVESLEYLEDHFNDPDLTLKSISQYLNVSPSYFSTIFKKETGKSFIDTLTEMKLKKAKELVVMTDYKMFEIAENCGYDDQHYFSYSFKKFYGISPTKMRKNKNEELNKI